MSQLIALVWFVKAFFMPNSVRDFPNEPTTDFLLKVECESS